MQNTVISDLGLILVEYDDLDTQEAETQKNEETTLPDAFLKVLEAICSSFKSWSNATKIARDFSRGRSFDATDLPLICFLKEFDDYFDGCQSDYERNVENIVPVEANNPFYKVEIGNRMLLFSPRLVFCQNLLESAINRSMNDVFALLDECRATEDELFEDVYTNATQVSIHRISTYLKQFFFNCDNKQDCWMNIVSDLQNAYLEPFDEKCVFYHLLAAQMCRYWLEFKRRKKYRMDGLEVEVSRFYRTYIGILPDTGIIDIVPADKPIKPTAECKENADTEKKIATTKEKKEEKDLRKVSFLINDEDTVSALCNILCDTYKIIPMDDKQALEYLLSGRTSSTPIHWPRKYRVLLGLFIQDMWAVIIDKRGKLSLLPTGERDSIDRKKMQRLVTVTKAGTSQWEVVYEWFVDENNKYYEPKEDKLKDARFAKKWADILKKLHRALLGIGKDQPVPKFR